MPALMPRCTDCVLCGEPIQGKGRIDRIYCSASCRTLAWRARAGHRFDGRRRPKMPPQPGDFVARKALPLLAVRMRAQLAAAKRRIAELEERLADQRGGAEHVAANVAVGAAAAIGAIGIAAALRRRRRRRERAEQTGSRDRVEAERQSHQAELTAERERAERREAELLQQVTALMTRAEQADAREQTAVASLSTLRHNFEALRHELNLRENSAQKMHFDMAALQCALLEAHKQSSRQSEALLEESQQRQRLQLQINETRRHLGILRQELEATDATLTEESQQRQRLQLQLTAVQRQLGAERREWQAARALLTQHAQEEQNQLVADNRQLRYPLAEQQPRDRVAPDTITEPQQEVGNQKHRYQERTEKLQRKQLADSQVEPNRLLGTKDQKQLPDKKQQNHLPAPSGLAGKVLLTTFSGVKGAAGGTRLRVRDSQSLPAKEVGASFEDTPVPDRKRLPPKRE